MKRRNILTKALVLVALVAGFSFIITTWHAPHAQAIQDSEDRPSPFGFIDLGVGQTARLNIVIGNPDTIGDPDTPPSPPHTHRLRLVFDIYALTDPATITAASCSTRYKFSRRESCDVELTPGQAASFDFTAAEGAKVAASVHALGGPDTRVGENHSTPEPHLVPSLEVREGARTIFVVPAVAKFFNPQPDPPGPQQ